MPDFGIFRGFNDKLFGDKLYAGQLPTQLGLIGSENFGYLYLLDDYPAAAAAYSLRLLRSAYTGSAIRVRRASDNTEQDVGFVNNELDTATLTSFCSGTNGFVKTWYDQSGNGRDATQATASNQPQIVSSGSVILQDTKPAIQFGLSSGMRLEVSYNVTSPIRSFTTFKATLANGGFVFDGLNINEYRIFIESTTRLTAYGNNFGIVEPEYVDNSGILNKNYLSDFLAEVGNARFQINDNPADTGAVGTTNKTGIKLGIRGNNTNLLVGFISEYIEYNSTQSDNADGIKSNINDFYSIY